MKIVNAVKRIVALNNAIERGCVLYNKMYANNLVSDDKIDEIDDLLDSLRTKHDTLKKSVNNWVRSERLTRSEYIARRSQLEFVCRHLNVNWLSL